MERLIDQEYRQIGEKPYYVRRDLIVDLETDEESRCVKTMTPSPELAEASAITLHMPAAALSDGKEIMRVGVMIGTNGRENSGEAELRMTSADGSIVSRKFALSGLRDNRYVWFDLPSGKYVSGEIRALSGGGISALERQDEDGVLTWILYQFSDGRFGFTPGCPPL